MYYVATLRRELERELGTYEQLRMRPYSALVKLWIEPSGLARRFEIVERPGSREMSLALESAPQSLERVGVSPPDRLPQPVWVRINSRGQG
jgi:hypothetical protein